MKKRLLNIIFYVLLVFGIFLLIYSGVYLYKYYSNSDILVHYPDNFKTDKSKLEPNEIGDSIGGILNPIIGFTAAILTFLAFYIQFRANQIQRELFKEGLEENKKQFQEQLDEQKNQIVKQQFEAQFYEMLRLHKENVNEIELLAKKRYEVKGHDRSYYEYESYLVTKRNAFVELKNEFEFILSKNLEDLDGENIKYYYEIFFWGLGGFNKDENKTLVEEIEESEENTLENILRKAKKNQYNTEIDLFEEKINFNIVAFEGHSEFLGHYYRHLFHIVKFVVSLEFLSYNEKRRYLRILRAQLSNHEQIMLFYNWMAGYGDAWENNDNKFFTEYCMIHNLWYKELYKNNYIATKVKELKNKPTKYRKEKMFEMDSGK